MSNLSQTVFFVPNLHCPTCSAHIEDALHRLKPRPAQVSTSIISHAVTVEHAPSLRASDISRALEEAGFEIFDTIEDPASESSDKASEKDDDRERGKPSFAFEQALWKWRPHTTNNDDQKRMKHIQACQLCQLQTDQLHDHSHEQDSNGSENEKKTTFVATDLGLDSTERYQATIAIEGMTCSSCVGSVTKALEEIPWVHSVSVSLLTHSASVEFHGKHHGEELADAIEDIGFGASLETVEALETRKSRSTITMSDLWKATYAIEGMTCSACVGNISRALKDTPWIKEVEVALISNSATVIFEGKRHMEEIHQAIEDVGYEATLDSIANLQTEGKAKTRRHSSFRISGMYCQHCPGRIEQAIKDLGSISIEKLPTLNDPILSVLYMPQQPNLTIRHILKAIAEADEAFSAKIYHPMTLEERSRKMQAREQRHMFYRVLLSVAAAIPSFIIGIVFIDLVPMSNSTSQYLAERIHGVTRFEWATFIMATPVYFFAADVFHRRTFRELRALWRKGSPTPILRRFYRFGSMNMLICFGTTIAYFSSIAELAIIASHEVSENMEDITRNPTYFDSVVFLTMFLLIGRLLEAYTKAKTGDAVAELGKLRPAETLLVSSNVDDALGTVHQISVDQVEIGDIVRILNGASPPFDGVIVEGESKFDESTLTGESKLINKKVGDEVFSGTINKESPVSVRIDGVEGKSLLDSIMRVVREGQARRAPVERVADLITGYFVPVVTLIALMTWVIWMSLGLSGSLPKNYLDIHVGGWPFWALEFAIAVFVVACPCGIGLAAPTALFVGGGLAAKHGILVKGGGEAFQEASNLSCIVFDKTGTITQGREPEITDYEICNVEPTTPNKGDVLGVVQAVESESSHPVARALVAFCKAHEAKFARMTDIEEIAGRGMRGKLSSPVNGFADSLVGNESLMADYKIAIDSQEATKIDSWKRQGKSVALLALKHVSQSSRWRLAAVFAISDPLRPEAKTVVRALKDRSIDVWMISGDNQTTANAVGEQVGIPQANIIAGVLPSQKSEQIKKLQHSVASRTLSRSKRGMVAMVGDGINDSPALTTADVGIAIGSGSDVAISSAEFVLVSSNLLAILTLTDLSRAVFRRIKFNFGWALIYNMLALPIAAGVLYPIRATGEDPDHVRLDPVWAALAMALSSVSVVCSSLLLRTTWHLVGFRRSKEANFS